ncbi:hypothetical protein L228DRAFT_254589 [Xylona heveae TC161]|uniref:Uncharacterized protein n=1 Tax=Xylona heveae (strain CBS 132557 / TC161) TaxID=1328760 RepID=A0A164Z884_XYLHT|nr:hypothetical protein L228DRAFT_254589 [Xylona heveae TC161]KZF18807.1 hypothetical protein L228DRAFT_254589 [Xylona heveae TC161]
MRSRKFHRTDEELQGYKQMYHKLHNLENFPSVLPEARDMLISFFAETLDTATKAPERGILGLKKFDVEQLTAFLKAKDDNITQRWENYLARRARGAPRELFKDLEHAKWFLRQSAPNKMVDGAWLGHVHNITTPFALRRITKNAWQVFSEEVGDGDLTKNHAYIYASLTKEIEAGLPDASSHAFVEPSLGLNEIAPWKAGLSQLLISLFPHEFLPEILGFNMHFEMLTWDTMRAIKELEELKLDSYYFLLHISIDNADSGHTAMAMQAVIDFLNHVKKTEGTAAAHQAWKRVQAGFILSESLPSSPSNTFADVLPKRHPNKLEAEVLRAFKTKAPVAHKLHCGTRVSIQRRSLVDWLEPNAFESEIRQMEFLDALSNSKPWIYKGHPERSRLIQSLEWEGKMFGSFTQTEVEDLRKWIESLARPMPNAEIYWSFTRRTAISSEIALKCRSIRVAYPVIGPATDSHLSTPGKTLSASELTFQVASTSRPALDKLLPLWFTHTCLLEAIVTIPIKTTDQSTAAVLRVLRAQYGFAPEGSGVAGMDEVRRTDSIDLVQLGLEMIKAAGLPQPQCLSDVLCGRESGFADEMLHMSMRPMENRELLMGMSLAFVNLHESLATSSSINLLSMDSKAILADMAAREREGLRFCLEELRSSNARYARFCQGYEMGKQEIESCF